MKRILLTSLVVCLLAGTATAGSAVFGARAGLTLSPDQIHVGGHVDLGQVTPSIRIVPNVELGFGDNLTFIAINGDVLYDFANTPWSVGGELGINTTNFDTPDIPGVDIDSSATDVGLSALGNYRLVLSSGKTLILEAKLGLTNSPDVKFTLGYNF